MRYGIFSDVHSNLEALQAVLTALKEESVDQLLCPGDIVGYGANPNECVAIIRELKAVSIAGNHDWAVIGKIDARYFNPVAFDAVDWTRKHITQQTHQFLEKLTLVVRNEDLLMVHASLPNPEEFDYLMDTSAADRMFSAMDKDICFIGHTHAPVVFVREHDQTRVDHVLDMEIRPGSKYIVNVGSVGQPRDNDSRAAYCIFDTAARTVSIKRVSYDIKKAQKKIIAAGLPSVLASRLGYGE